MKRFSAGRTLGMGLVLTFMGIAAVAAQTTDQRFASPIEGLQGAFVGLSTRADMLAFHKAMGPEATLCKHYQGFARKDGPDGTPYLFITKSGNSSVCPGDEEDGALFVVRLGSRPKNGERLRRNVYPYASSDLFEPFDSADVPAEDRVIKVIRFNGQGGLPRYRHPGGMQIVDDVLAIGTENPAFASHPRAVILFFDVSNPEEPRFLRTFVPPDLDGIQNAGFGADPVGLTPVKVNGTCCRYLMVSTGGPPSDDLDYLANAEVRFYLSEPDPGLARLKDTVNVPDYTWQDVGRFFEAHIETCNPGFNWPTGVPTQHQMLNFVREGNLDGPLYLYAGWRDGTVASPLSDEDEFIDLWRVNLKADGTPNSCPITFINQKRVGLAGIGPALQSWGDNIDNGSFAAGSGIYVTPSGEVNVYVTDHRTTILGEYRRLALARPNSPTLRPTATVGGPFAVDEGASVQLTGQGEGPITKAFVQLFEGRRAGIGHVSDPWLNVEYDERNLDHFDDLCKLNLGNNLVFDPCGDVFPDPLWDKVTSVRWFAPPGCNIQANNYPIRSDDFPGPGTVILRGTGQIETVDELSELRVTPGASGAQPPWAVTPPTEGSGELYNYDNTIEGVTFYEAYRADGALVRRHGCDAYYNAAFSLGWDLDANGSFEASGTSVPFAATNLDGPSTKSVQARATHPTDTSPTGVGAPIAVTITVRNVPPHIEAASVKDPLGYDLNGGARFAVVGVPVTLAATFTDPGRPDTQTGAVDWGDGTPLDSSFATFTDARDGATGQLRDKHAYVIPGPHTLTATITDDDGGATPVQLTVTVLSLEDAIEAIADQLTQLIAAATDSRVRSALTAARDELIGNHTGTPPTNGALDKLEADNPVDAITKLKAAIAYLATAEERGAGNLGALKDLIGLIAEGIATAAYIEAEQRVAPPSPGEAKALATIAALIQLGDQQLAVFQYASACDNFRQAAQKALALR